MPPRRTQRATSGRPPARHRSRSPQGRPQAEQAPTGQERALGNQAPAMAATAGPPQDPAWWQTPAAAQDLHHSSSPEVLILGSSIVRRLERDLVQWGRTLRLPLPVRFAGQSGLQFSGLRTLLEGAIEGPPPAYLVLHVGANDIGRLNTVEWAQELQLWLAYIGARYPTTRVVWSDMLPRRTWRYSVDPAGAERARKRGTRRARHLVAGERGWFIKHPRIVADDACLAADGVHLSSWGTCLLAWSLEESLTNIILGSPVWGTCW
ncbi:uncharacterized protein [Littorina saxatilis]|uniref:uncharacterized protein isoform X2 n=1 Tax=Littorina saxatilis TaxID=31220 RepID=UPI0038B5D044